MYLTEKHIIKKSHPFYDECDNLCFQSKNIYNQAVYNVRQHYFNNKTYLNYYANYDLTKTQECYDYLPKKVFCQTLKLVDRNFKAFFGGLKSAKVKKARLPKYLDKTDGRFIAIFPKQAVGQREFKKNRLLHLSQTEMHINTKLTEFNSLKEVRIIPREKHYVIEVVYEVKGKSKKTE